jgi:light-regulated signal transduction histidine kinase (bacteriophytochrome)
MINEKNALVTHGKLPVLVADENQIVQLFQNLIDNGIKFSRNSPRIHILAREENDHFVFSVKDNGIGIESQYFSKIFRIFQRLVPKDQYDGTGIGLAICKRIVERHEGKIWVESEPEKGSTFFFTIPKYKLDEQLEKSYSFLS